MKNDGMIHPSVHIKAPRGPAKRVPTKVAEFIEIGPGVISAIVIKSVNSAIDINARTLTI